MNFVEILEHHLLDHRLATLFTLGHTPVYLTVHGLMLIIAAALLLTLLMVARKQAREVPTGLGNAVEAFIIYIRDEIVRPNMGHAGDGYVPYFLTLFFFILF